MERNMEAVRELLEAARHLDEKGILNAIEGNVSLRRDGLIYVTPSGKNKAFLTEDMIAVVDEDGNQLYGSCRPSSELKLHLQVYRTRREVGGVVHAHPTCLAAHAVCGLPIRTKAYAELLTVYGSFEVAPYGRPGTDDIWKGIGPLLEKSSVILLENHGALAVGPDVRQAMDHMEAAEAIARVLVTARLLGKEKELPEEECEALLFIQKENQRNLIS